MITRQMSHIHKQVSSVVDSMINSVVHKNPKRVTWLACGISEARTFVIEPWRRMGPTPVSSIKQKDAISANPFTLPIKMKQMKPYFDYSKWSPPKPLSPISCCGSPPKRPNTRSQSHYMTPISAIMESSDTMVRCVPVFEQPRLARCDTTISLAEIYEIAEKIKQAEQGYGSYDKFIDESETHMCGVKAKME